MFVFCQGVFFYLLSYDFFLLSRSWIFVESLHPIGLILYIYIKMRVTHLVTHSNGLRVFKCHLWPVII